MIEQLAPAVTAAWWFPAIPEEEEEIMPERESELNTSKHMQSAYSNITYKRNKKGNALRIHK